MIRDICIRVNDAIEKYMFLLTPAGVALGLLMGDRIAFLQPISTFLFAFIAFIATLSITFKDFCHSMKLKPIAAMILCNHVLVPLAAWFLLGLAIDRNSGFFMGMMLIFAGPCSTSSMIWSGITGGDKGLSTAFVVLDTTLCFVYTPLILALSCGTTVTINIAGLALNLVKMVLIPSVLAMVISSFILGKEGLRKASPYIKIVTKVFLLIVIMFTVSGMASSVASIFRLEYFVVMACTLLLLVACFFFGLFVGKKILRSGQEETISMCLVMGAKNIGLDLILAAQLPDPIAVVPPMITFFFLDIITAFISKFLQTRLRKPVEAA